MTQRSKRILVSVALVALSLTVIAASASNGNAVDPTVKEDPNEFAGKVVTVYLSDPQKGAGQILTNAELKQIGDRVMLVGTGADTGREDDWTSGVRVGIAWDSIEIYYAMTQKQFDEKMKKHTE